MGKAFLIVLFISLLLMTACVRQPFDWQSKELQSQCIGLKGADRCSCLVESGAVKVTPGQGRTQSQANEDAKQACREQMPPW